MSQAEDLLNSLTADSDVEEHIVIGKDRFITVPQSLKKIAVQYDNNVRTVTFDCPRYSDGRDLSTMDVSINYLRADGEPGLYSVSTVTIDEEDSSIMHFDWVIQDDVTAVSGTLSFLVCTKKTNSEGYNENHWNTELNQDMTISKGLNCTEHIITRYPDLIAQILLRLDEVEKREVFNATGAAINQVPTADGKGNWSWKGIEFPEQVTDDHIRELITGYNYSTFSGSYNDLSDKPEIPEVSRETIKNALGYVPSEYDDNLYDKYSGSFITIPNSAEGSALVIKTQNDLAGHTVTSCGKNLFNINGDVNIDLKTGEDRPGHVIVENGVLSVDLYTSSYHPNGQRLYNLKGKTISFSALCISEDVNGYIGIYEDGNEGEHTTGQGLLKIENYVCKSDNPIFGFNTAGRDTGAKFINIQIEIGASATDYAPYVSDSVSVSANDSVYSMQLFDGLTNIYNDCNANMTVLVSPALRKIQSEAYVAAKQEANAYTDQNVSAMLNYIHSIVKPYELTWIDGYYVSKDDGSVKAEAGSSCTDFVPVEPGDKLIISNTMTTDTEYNVFYDLEKNFVSSFSTNNGNVVIVPDGAKNFRLSKHTADTVIVMPEVFIEKPKATVIDLPISGWTGSNLLYQQTVSVPIVKENSQVELRPSPAQLQELLTSEISLTAANESGYVTVFAIGGKPISDYTMQIIVSEVVVV